MNKYQEALVEVEEIAYKQYEDACYNKTTKARAMEYERKLKNDTKILQELVDKATPVKPVVLTKTICCSKCDTRLGNNNGWTQATVNFCPTCGQAILWEE